MVLNFLKIFLKYIPLFSGLIRAKKHDHKFALQQVTVVLIFALFPTILFTFWGFLGSSKSELILEASQTITHGELFMICTSLLGPVAYLAITEQGPSSEPLLNKVSFSFATFFLIVFSSIAYLATQKYEKYPENATLISLYFFGITVLLFYLANVYQNVRVPSVNLENDEIKKSKELSEDW